MESESSLPYLQQYALFPIQSWTNQVHENCTLLGYYAVSSGNFLPKYRDKLSVPSSGVKNPKFGRAQFSYTSRWKPEVAYKSSPWSAIQFLEDAI